MGGRAMAIWLLDWEGVEEGKPFAPMWTLLRGIPPIPQLPEAGQGYGWEGIGAWPGWMAG